MNSTILRQSKDAAAAWAAGVLQDEKALILDTETTGLGGRDQVIQLGVINTTGDVLLDTNLRPTVEIDPMAASVHGLTVASLREAPRMSAIQPRLFELLVDASRLIIYNKAFDIRMLNQTLLAFDCRSLADVPNLQVECAMRWYAEWFGEWNEQRNSFKWQKLPGAGHDAVGDCQATLACLQMMARHASMAGGHQAVSWSSQGMLQALGPGPGMEDTYAFDPQSWAELGDGA